MNFYEDCLTHPVLQTATELGPIHISIADYWPLSDEDREKVRLKLLELTQQYNQSEKVGHVVDVLIPELENGKLFKSELKVRVETEKALFVRLNVLAPFLEKLRDELLGPDFRVYTGSEYVVRKTFHASLLRDDKPSGKSFGLSDFAEILHKYPLVEQMFTSESGSSREWERWVHQIQWTVLLTSQTGERMKFVLHE